MSPPGGGSDSPIACGRPRVREVRADGGTEPDARDEEREHPDIDDLLDKLETLQETVDDEHERRKVTQTIALVERMPGSRAFTHHVRKYTTRDIAEGIVGAIIFSLPLLVEDGVFVISEWLLDVRLGRIPVFFVLNVAFIVTLVYGLLYFTDIREVRVTRPIFGVIPRRVVGILVSSFLVGAGLMFMWGRLHEDAPTSLEMLARITVIWAPAAFGATLGDILPGESKGEDIGDLIAELGDGEGSPPK